MSENEGVGRESRVKPSIGPYIWYISYRSKTGTKPESRLLARGTQRFRSEAEAKQFALEVISNGWSAIGGTINPYKPKRVISCRQILDWIAEKE